jgi:hypothetical protein
MGRSLDGRLTPAPSPMAALYCWGADGRPLGDGTGKASETPVRVAEPRASQ